METVTPVALLAFVVFTLLNLVRFIRGGLTGQGWNGAVTIIASWIVGIVAAWVFGLSDVGEDIVIPGFTQTLGDMNFADLLLVGLAIASSAGALNEIRGAIDQTTTTAKPKLVQDTPPPTN